MDYLQNELRWEKEESVGGKKTKTRRPRDRERSACTFVRYSSMYSIQLYDYYLMMFVCALSFFASLRA